MGVDFLIDYQYNEDNLDLKPTNKSGQKRLKIKKVTKKVTKKVVKQLLNNIFCIITLA